MQTKGDLCNKRTDTRQKFSSSTNVTMHRVREATLKHLREIGATIEPVEESDEHMCIRYGNSINYFNIF